MRKDSLFAASALICALLVSVAAQADSKFQVDPRVDLQALTASGEIKVFGDHGGNNYWGDASAVITGDYSKLATASENYNSYLDYGMPYLKASRIVGSAGPDILYVWNWMELSMSGFTETTKHCFEVRFSRQLPGNSGGSQWQIHPCPLHAQAQLPGNLQHDYEDAPAFDYLNGAWYMQPVSGSGAQQRIYVRYFMEAKPSNPLAVFAAGKIVTRFKHGAQQVIQILARQAAPQP